MWDVDSTTYSWERPISTVNTAFSYVAQLRSWMPDDIGGVAWFGEDDTYFTCYMPLYVSISDIPLPLKTGDMSRYSDESAWWIFNFVSNFVNIRYSDMIQDILPVQAALEAGFVLQQDSIESIAQSLSGEDRIAFLTKYSAGACTKVCDEWKELGNLLITKYNDGYIKDENGGVHEKGYPDAWKAVIIKNDADRYRIPE